MCPGLERIELQTRSPWGGFITQKFNRNRLSPFFSRTCCSFFSSFCQVFGSFLGKRLAGKSRSSLRECPR